MRRSRRAAAVRSLTVFLGCMALAAVPAWAQEEPTTCLTELDQPGLATIPGTNGPDYLLGTPGDDVIIGEGGDDVIAGRGGDDIICGGPGSDTLSGGDGHDSIDGADDTLLRLAQQDLPTTDEGDDINGDNGDDFLVALDGDDRIVGHNGDDFLNGERGSDRAFGGPGDDFIVLAISPLDVSGFGELAQGDEGDDSLLGSGAADLLRGGAGDDHLFGANGDDTLLGGDGDDEVAPLRSEEGEVTDVENGDDAIRGGRGDDFLDGGPGTDRVDGDQDTDECLNAEVVLECELGTMPAATAKAARGRAAAFGRR